MFVFLSEAETNQKIINVKCTLHATKAKTI